MEVIIKPYESKYRNGVVDVLQYLWQLSESERYARFDWLFESNTNPSFRETLAVVAVNDNDDVLGFRGWVPGIVWQDGKKYVVARAADVVVSPKGRRQGVFSKMTTYSLSFLREKGIDGIINLSSNSQSNPGYIKLCWRPLARLNIWYRMNFERTELLEEKKEFKYYGSNIGLYPFIPKGLTVPSDERLGFSMKEGQLDWYAERPDRNYLTAVTYDKRGQLSSLFIMEKRSKITGLSFFYCKDQEIGKYAFKQLCRRIENHFIAVWGCALSKDQKSLLRRMGFFKVPFYEGIKRNPPILVRTIGDVTEESDWKIGSKDMRDLKNWSINLIDNF